MTSRWLAWASASAICKRVADRLDHRQRAFALDQIAQVFAFDELEDDVVQTPVETDVIHAGDVVVVEPGRALGFVAEPPQGFFFVGLKAREHFHRDFAVQGRIQGPKNGPHAAAADELLQHELPEAFSLEHPADFQRRQQTRIGQIADRAARGNDRDLIVEQHGLNPRSRPIVDTRIGSTTRCRPGSAGWPDRAGAVLPSVSGDFGTLN